MIRAATLARPPLRLDWRRVEFAAIALALFVQSSAVFPLLAMDSAGDLGASARALLRLLSLPVYLVAIGLLLIHSGQWIIAMRRSLPLLCLIALPFVSILWSISPSYSLRRAVALLFSVLLAYALAIRTTPAQLLRLLALVLGGCLVLSLGLMVAAPGLAQMPEEAALRGVFTHKNVLGWAASLATVAAGVMIYDRGAGQRVLGWGLFVPSLACLVLSQSATSLLAALCGLGLGVFYEAMKRKQGLGRWLVVLVFLQLAAVILIGLGSFLVPLLETLGKDATLTGRVQLWELVDAQIAARPLLGYGYQAFWTENNPAAWDIWERVGWAAPHAHNGFRDMLLGFGAVGTLVFAAILVSAIRRGAALHCACVDARWLWPNILIGQILIINLSETSLLAQNDLQWTLFTVVLLWIGFSRTNGRAGG